MTWRWLWPTKGWEPMSRPRDRFSWTLGVQDKLAELGVLDGVVAEVKAGIDLEPLTVRLRELVGPDLMVDDWVQVAEWGPPNY